MRRRQFLTRSLAAATASTLASSADPALSQQVVGESHRQFYDLRQYRLQMGPQPKLVDDFVAGALIPALNRLGITPVGAFHLDVGPETPSLYLLLPSGNAELLATADLRLAEDTAF